MIYYLRAGIIRDEINRIIKSWKMTALS